MQKAAQELPWKRARHGSWFEQHQTKSLNEWHLRDPPLELAAPEFPREIDSQFWHSLWLPLLLSSVQTIMAVLLQLLTAMPFLSVLSLWLYRLDYSQPHLSAVPCALAVLLTWCPIAEGYMFGINCTLCLKTLGMNLSNSWVKVFQEKGEEREREPAFIFWYDCSWSLLK